MPVEFEHDGHVGEWFSAQEIARAVEEGRAGLISAEEAQRQADGAAARARRAAEAEVKTLQARLEEMGAESAELARVREEQALAERALHGVKALVRSGIGVETAEELLGLPALREVDFRDTSATASALDALRAKLPGVFSTGAAPSGGLVPLGGVGGSPAPVAPPAELGSLTMSEYIRQRSRR